MRIVGRIEKAVLALVAGFVFMAFATVVSPGLQTLVAPVACPAGSVDAVVVRYPHVVEPVEMVRNTPLVCVGRDGAVLASHARVLPVLIALGFVTAGAAIVLLSIAAAVVRRNSSSPGAPPTPTPPRSVLDTLRWVTLVVAAPFVFMVAYGSYWWLAVDTPYRVTSCQSSSGGSATCYDGESVYRFLTLLFGALALATLVPWVIATVRSVGRSRSFARLWGEGVRAKATLVGAEATGTKVNERRIFKFTYEVQPEDGSPPFRFVEKGARSPAGTQRGTVDVIYDRGDTSVAFTIPPELAAQPPRPESDPSPLISS